MHRLQASINRDRRRQGASRARGLTLIECLLAMVILSIAVLGLIFTATAGHQHSHLGDTSLRATRLAEQLIEEILSRPYDGNGTIRADWHIDDYDGFAEAAGSLTDSSGSLYPKEDQVFSRSVSISSSLQTVASLDDIDIAGKTIVITVQDASGVMWRLSRFLPESGTP